MPHFNPLIDFPLILLAYAVALARERYTGCFEQTKTKFPKQKPPCKDPRFELLSWSFLSERSAI